MKMATNRRLEVSEIVNVRDFLSKWDQRVYVMCAEESSKISEKIAEQMNITLENVKELGNVCR